MLRLLHIFLLMTIPARIAAVQVQEAASVVDIQLVPPATAIAAGETATIDIKLRIQNGWHINSHQPLDEFLIPTSIEIDPSPFWGIEQIDYPPGKVEKFSFSETGMSVYAGEVTIRVRLSIASQAGTPSVPVSGKLTYQACNDVMCLAPVSKSFTTEISVQPAATSLRHPASQIRPLRNPDAVAEQSMSAPPPDPTTIVQADVLFSLDKVLPGDRVNAAIRLRIQNGWHINSAKPHDEFLIPTEIRLDPIDGVQFGAPVFPPDKLYRFSFSDEDVAVYEGEIFIGVPMEIDADFTEKRLTVSGEVRYQACNDAACLAPASVQLSGTIPIAARDEAIALTHAEIFETIAFDTAPAAVEENNEIGGLIAEKGLALTFLLIFLGGLALNLTPCVYPLIPITVTFFGGQARGSLAKMLILATIYVLGMAITYSAMGVGAALSGSLFGSLLQNPIVLIFIALVMVGLASSMFGLWELTLPQWLNQLAGGGRQGYLGSLLMGLTVGIVAAPCIGPFVLGLLTYVSTTGNPMLGFWMFFTLSLGLGLPYVILGTFSGSIKNLPRAGVWMVWVKKIFGFVLLAMAAYFITPILPKAVAPYLLPAVLFTGGVVIGLLDRTQMASRVFPAIKRLAGFAFIAVAAWLVWPAGEAHAEIWQDFSRDRLEQARASGTPVVIDFTADWCISCKELEKLTFPSEPVMARAKKFLLLRADLTKFASPPVEEIKKEFNIKGLPTVVFIGSDGREIKELRVIGFADGAEFARRMDLALRNP